MDSQTSAQNIFQNAGLFAMYYDQIYETSLDLHHTILFLISAFISYSIAFISYSSEIFKNEELVKFTSF